MPYYQFQQKIYQNKIKRNFNVTNIGKEIILMAEEHGELCDAYLTNNKTEFIDSVGDIMVYCLGLSAMFEWNCDNIHNFNTQLPDNLASLPNYILYVGKEIGMIAKTYKKSNKQEIKLINKLDEFRLHLGNLIGYCDNTFKFMGIDGISVLESIVSNNKTRTHQGQV